MDTKMASKALFEVIPLRICVTFRRASFWYQPKNSKSRLWDDWDEHTTNTGPESHDVFSGKIENHEHRSELDPYSTFRAETQGF